MNSIFDQLETTFIWGDYFDNVSICDDLINFFEDPRNEHNKIQGTISQRIDKTRKDSTDIIVDPRNQHPAVVNYITQLNIICEKYKKSFLGVI